MTRDQQRRLLPCRTGVAPVGRRIEESVSRTAFGTRKLDRFWRRDIGGLDSQVDIRAKYLEVFRNDIISRHLRQNRRGSGNHEDSIVSIGTEIRIVAVREFGILYGSSAGVDDCQMIQAVTAVGAGNAALAEKGVTRDSENPLRNADFSVHRS